MGATSRRIAPPLPDASHPSNNTSTGGPRRPSPGAPGTGSPPHRSRSASSRCWAASMRLASSSRESLSERSSLSKRPTRPTLSSDLLPPHRPVEPNPSFPHLEERVLERWRERDVFRESLRRREGAERFVFYEGPPTVNGPPGAHHVLARVFKDIFPRYKTMQGYYVERKGGFDCHGLPVEIQVEKQIGSTGKEDIERFGIGRFNALCRESALSHIEVWNRLTERIAFWVDLDDAYRTMDADYVESVWWALRQLHDKGLLYEGHKVVPYCPRCGTALSSHELAQGYEDVVDPSIYVRLPVAEDGGPLQAGDELLVWTTTPWTLVSNAAVAVDPELTYVRAKA